MRACVCAAQGGAADAAATGDRPVSSVGDGGARSRAHAGAIGAQTQGHATCVAGGGGGDGGGGAGGAGGGESVAAGHAGPATIDTSAEAGGTFVSSPAPAVTVK